jgi:O-succinylbenzoate synthase
VKIDAVALRHVRLPLLHPFETSFGRTTEKEFLLVSVSAGGVSGHGECVADTDPFYLPETLETARHVLRDFLLPMAFALDLAHPRELWPALARVRGHQMAKAGLEMAVWELWARREGVPLHRLLGGRGGTIASGVSVGLQEDVGALVDTVAREVEAGYRRVKIKIKPGQDRALVEAVRARFPDLPLMADANSAYTLTDAPLFRELDAHRLMMVEQPLGWDDIVDHATLQRQIHTPVCLDESIRSPADARKALELGSCRIVNIKAGRVGGFAPSVEVHDVCRARGLVRRHAGVRHRASGQRAPADPARLHAARRHLGERALLRRGPDRSAGDRGRRRHDRGARRARHRPRDRVVTGGAGDRGPRGMAQPVRGRGATGTERCR